jgi:hypothetical protein
MALDFLLQKVKDAIYDDNKTPYQRGDTGGLIETIENIFGQERARQGTIDNPLPASQDPYGDPADLEPGGYGNQSNRGYTREEALRQQYPNLRPASEDPLGDPADIR